MESKKKRAEQILKGAMDEIKLPPIEAQSGKAKQFSRSRVNSRVRKLFLEALKSI